MKTATIRWIGQQQFLAISPSGHSISIDCDGETNIAANPMELLLMSLGACTATDVVSILKKKRQQPQSLEVICSAERAADPPRVWTKIEIVYRLRGHVEQTAAQRAIELSEEKYCSVSAMLQKTAKITWRLEILPPL